MRMEEVHAGIMVAIVRFIGLGVDVECFEFCIGTLRKVGIKIFAFAQGRRDQDVGLAPIVLDSGRVFIYLDIVILILEALRMILMVSAHQILIIKGHLILLLFRSKCLRMGHPLSLFHSSFISLLVPCT